MADLREVDFRVQRVLVEELRHGRLHEPGRLASGIGQALQGSFSAGWLARYRLYQSQILQENMRLKALAEIYTMHSFALL